MTSNQTFSKKLQAAIKAKIQELGVDADEDMAEYAMILAANKKDKSQMKKELHLFLGKNTGCFVDWLFAAFERIQKTLNDLKNADREKVSTKSTSNKVSSKAVTERTSSNKSASSNKKDVKSSKTPSSRDKRPSKHEDRAHSSKSKSSADKISSPSTKRRQTKWDDPSKHEKSSKRDRSPKDDRHSSSRHKRTSPAKEKSKEPTSKLQKEDSKKRRHEKTNFIEEATKVSDSEGEETKNGHSAKNEAIKPKSSESLSKRPRIQAPSPKHSPEREDSNERQKRNSDESPNNSSRKQRSSHSISSSHQKQSPGHSKISSFIEQKSEERATSRSNDSTPTPLTNVWDGRITIDDESSDDDAEAQIDALLEGLDELIDTIPETSILSGANLSTHLIQQGDPSSAQSASNTPSIVSTSTSGEAVPKKLMEKCRFWPGCEKKEQCSFHHPVEVCSVFPNCPFGDRCLNIHPLCKFNKKCRKPRCPFTHDLKGAATVVLYPHDVAAAQQAIVAVSSVPKPVIQNNVVGMCRFKGRCAVPDCKFLHPPACRFGLRCKNPNCNFSHRKPDLAKFRWVNNTQE